MPVSTKSKRSTGLATGSKKPAAKGAKGIDRRRLRLGPNSTDIPDEINYLLDLYWGGPERRITGLTRRIIAMNALALLILAIGLLYLGQYQNSLIQDKLATFKAQTEVIAVAMEQHIMDGLPPEPLARRLSQRIDHRIRVFDGDGILMIDTHEELSTPEISSIEEDRIPWRIRNLEDVGALIIALLPNNKNLPTYPYVTSRDINDYPDVQKAMEGLVELSAWSDRGDIFLSGAAPLNDTRDGVVLITRKAKDISDAVARIWMDVLNIFFGTLVLTVLVSIYFSGLITNPLKRLSRAAEAVRKGQASADEIPDLSARKDEIGDLSLVLRSMTRALYDRMDSIERFAADVAHELKNPLTSMRSAVETLGIVKKKADREKMLAILQHDVERLDRLVSDISQASRLDAALSREEFARVDVKQMLRELMDLYRDPLQRNVLSASLSYEGKHLRLQLPPDGALYVYGAAPRLIQVFENVIGNALSFAKEGDQIDIIATTQAEFVRIHVCDQGPGIPKGKLKTIFERFYSERPDHEDYGNHSGLGLSICRQILDAHGGAIEARNLKDHAGTILGAEFTVTLKRYER